MAGPNHRVTSSNREIGSAWTAHVLGALFDSWPKQLEFNALDVSTATACEPQEDTEETFDDLMLWLRQNGFIDFSQACEGNVFGVALTEKGFTVLGSNPEGLDRPLGVKLKETVATSAGEARSAAIAALIGALLGAAWR